MKKIKIKINGALYEVYSDVILDIADMFINNIDYDCEMKFKNEQIILNWPETHGYAVINFPRKREWVTPKKLSPRQQRDLALHKEPGLYYLVKREKQSM